MEYKTVKITNKEIMIRRSEYIGIYAILLFQDNQNKTKAFIVCYLPN